MGSVKNELEADKEVPFVMDKISPIDAIQLHIAQNKPAIGRMVAGVFEISTLPEAEKLSTMLAANTPCPEKAALGFWELLSNAIEHGNLEIDMETKGKLLLDGTIEKEIERRLRLEPYRSRTVRVMFKRTKTLVRLRVDDQGQGFDFKTALASEMPLDRPNGRGIHVARNLCFDKIVYKGCGNSVVADIKL